MKGPIITFALISSLFILMPTNVGFAASSQPTLNLAQRVSGKILLQVQKNGEAWYVDPITLERHYLADGKSAYGLLRDLGLGISNADLSSIPAASNIADLKSSTDSCQDSKIAERLRGRILLQVESLGEAWYVNPGNCRRLYLKDGDSAYQVMRLLGLGISDTDLLQIDQAPASSADTGLTASSVIPNVGPSTDLDNSINNCKEIGTEDAKLKCFIKLAIDQNDVSICKKSDDPDGCYPWVAIGMNDDKICLQDTNISACYGLFAWATQNNSACGLITDSYNRLDCYGHLAVLKKDPSICMIAYSNEKDYMDQAFCLGSYGYITQNTAVCDYISKTGNDATDKLTRDSCISAASH